MQRPEIVAGLKNAIERGYSMQLAMWSFINAGYSKQDVEDSARMLGGAILRPEDSSIQDIPPPSSIQPDSEKLPVKSREPMQEKYQPQLPSQYTPPPIPRPKPIMASSAPQPQVRPQPLPQPKPVYAAPQPKPQTQETSQQSNLYQSQTKPQPTPQSSLYKPQLISPKQEFIPPVSNSTSTPQTKPTPAPQPQVRPQPKPQQSYQFQSPIKSAVPIEKKKGNSSFLIVLLLIVLFVLVGALISTIVFKEQIVEWIKSLSG